MIFFVCYRGERVGWANSTSKRSPFFIAFLRQMATEPNMAAVAETRWIKSICQLPSDSENVRTTNRYLCSKLHNVCVPGRFTCYFIPVYAVQYILSMSPVYILSSPCTFYSVSVNISFTIGLDSKIYLWRGQMRSDSLSRIWPLVIVTGSACYTNRNSSWSQRNV